MAQLQKGMMLGKRDENRKLSIDENAIMSSHVPEGNKVDVRPLHKLINEILILPSATAAPYEQAVVDSHLKSFKNSSSCLQELVKIVHKISSQLSCKCSGGGDPNSTTVALFNTLSHYSWEGKMVVALTAFAVIYGKCWLMVTQTDPLAESIKLLKQLPEKSKLNKIQSLIGAIVKMTNTIVEVADIKEPLPEKISTSNSIQTAVSWTVGSIVVCTSQILSLDDEYTDDDLSQLTDELVEMNSDLRRQLLNDVIELIIDENAIRNTHAPDDKKVDVTPLHELIKEMLKPWATTTAVEVALQDQLSCKCSGGADAKSTTVALFNTLSHYSWEAKIVLALAAFVVICTESLFMAEQTSTLAEFMKLLNQLPDKSRLSKIRSLINAMVRVTDTIVEVVKVDDSPVPVNISIQIQSAVSWTVGSVVVCTTQIIALDDQYTEDDLYKLTEKVNGMNTHLVQLLNTWRQSIGERKKREEEKKSLETVQEIKNIFEINTDDKMTTEIILEKLPVLESHDQVAEALLEAGLESSNLILGIDFTASNTEQGRLTFNNRSLHDIHGTPNPYEQAIAIIGNTLARFAKDNLVHCYGFGDATTEAQKVFSFKNDHSPCQGFEEVLTCYKRTIVPNLRLSGPTSFAPIVEAAIDIVEKRVDNIMFWLSLLMVSSYALSIVVVGVGDGPWDEMKKFANKFDDRKFDNFQFVNFTDIMMSKDLKPSQKEAAFALVALMKIPTQYNKAKELGMLGHTTGRSKKVALLPPPTRR